MKIDFNFRKQKSSGLSMLLVILIIIIIVAGVFGYFKLYKKDGGLHFFNSPVENAKLIEETFSLILVSGGCKEYYLENNKKAKECLASFCNNKEKKSSDFGALKSPDANPGRGKSNFKMKLLLGNVLKILKDGCKIEDPNSNKFGKTFSIGSLSDKSIVEASDYLTVNGSGYIEARETKLPRSESEREFISKYILE